MTEEDAMDATPFLPPPSAGKVLELADIDRDAMVADLRAIAT